MKRKKRKVGKCMLCFVRTTHTELVLTEGRVAFELKFLCLKCTHETPIMYSRNANYALMHGRTGRRIATEGVIRLR